MPQFLPPAALPARILTVCSGNICRSPAAELLLRSALAGPAEDLAVDGGRWSIGSAGTIGVIGHPVQREMAELLAASGGVAPSLLGAFAARRLTPALLGEADLVLAMATEHRTGAIELEPAVFRRTFTLKEFAALVSALPAEVTGTAYPSAGDRLRAVVAGADVLRRSRALRSTRELDIDDPYGRGEAAYRRAYVEIDAALAPIVAVLRGD